MTPVIIRKTVSNLVAPIASKSALEASFIDLAFHAAMCEAALEASLPQLRKTGTVSLVNGTQTYSLPTDMLKLFGLKVSGHRAALVRRTQEQLDEFDANWETLPPAGVCTYYEGEIDSTSGARSVVLVGAVTTAANGLLVRYLRAPKRLDQLATETSEVYDINAAHHLGLCYRTALIILSRQSAKALKDASSYQGVWQRTLELLKLHSSEDWAADQAGTVPVANFHAGVGRPGRRRF